MGETGVNQKLIFSNTEGGLVSKKQVYIAIRKKGERGGVGLGPWEQFLSFAF